MNIHASQMKLRTLTELLRQAREPHDEESRVMNPGQTPGPEIVVHKTGSTGGEE
jgi:hypothetical protein